MKKRFLVAYDYGTGGLWGLAAAVDEEEIAAKFPQLQIHLNRPAWMTEDIYDRVSSVNSFDVDDPETFPDWIRELATKN